VLDYQRLQRNHGCLEGGGWVSAQNSALNPPFGWAIEHVAHDSGDRRIQVHNGRISLFGNRANKTSAAVCSASFQTCWREADLEVCGTAGLETCATKK
jgi:hypothetical protein